MKCRADIEKLAAQKLSAAHLLMQNDMYDDAYYLAGYAIELYLKALVCKTLRIDDFFTFNKGAKEMYRPFKTHGYFELLILSGIYPEYMAAYGEPDFVAKWSIISGWTEESRYKCDKGAKDVKEFVTLAEEFCKWIQKHS